MTLVEPLTAEAFSKVPRRGLRTIRQRAAGVGSPDVRGTPHWLPLAQKERPRASHQPSIRCHLQAQGHCHPQWESGPACPVPTVLGTVGVSGPG